MANKILLSDLSKADDKIVENLNTVSDNLLTASSSITSFNSLTRKELTGPGYDSVRKKLSIYSALYKNASMIVSLISSDIKSSNSSVRSSMNGEEEIEYSDEIITALQNKIDNLSVANYLSLTGRETELEKELKIEAARNAYIEASKTFKEALNLLKAVRSTISSESAKLGGNKSSINKLSVSANSLNVSIVQ